MSDDRVAKFSLQCDRGGYKCGEFFKYFSQGILEFSGNN